MSSIIAMKRRVPTGVQEGRTQFLKKSEDIQHPLSLKCRASKKIEMSYFLILFPSLLQRVPSSDWIQPPPLCVTKLLLVACDQLVEPLCRKKHARGLSAAMSLVSHSCIRFGSWGSCLTSLSFIYVTCNTGAMIVCSKTGMLVLCFLWMDLLFISVTLTLHWDWFSLPAKYQSWG